MGAMTGGAAVVGTARCEIGAAAAAAASGRGGAAAATAGAPGTDAVDASVACCVTRVSASTVLSKSLNWSKDVPPVLVMLIFNGNDEPVGNERGCDVIIAVVIGVVGTDGPVTRLLPNISAAEGTYDVAGVGRIVPRCKSNSMMLCAQ